MLQPRFMVALLCGTSAFALMTFVMTGAPLAMVAEGISRDHAVLGIQWHVLAMFAPSFFTGHLIARFGKEKIVATGMAILAACAVVALIGITLAHFYIALVLLGIGWNFGFIGSTTMLSQAYRPEEASTAQGLNEPFVFGSMAVASISSGVLLNTLGWQSINILVLPIVTATLALLAWGDYRQRKLRAQ